MIYYFSGTGNSKWIAQELARLTGDEMQSIAALLSDGPTAVIAEKDTRIGVVFPIYAWGAPLIVEQFCKLIKLASGAYPYVVCTCGDEAGKAILRLKKIFAYQAAWSVKMPNNYIAGFDVDSPELERKKISDAGERVKKIAEAVLAKSSVYDVNEGSGAGVKTALVRPMFNRFARATSRFSVDESCNACGLCARICPIQAIQLTDGKPVWVKKDCTQCMGCINRCPQRAIQIGSGTRDRGRYYFHQDTER
jgi:ferredoxin